jgi:hypothetical protein
MKITTAQKAKQTKLSTQEVEDMIKKLRKEHDKMVKGKFEFIDAQGGWLDFTYRYFPGDAIQTIHIDHGEICELPMGLVKHLNNVKKKIRRINLHITEKGNGVPTSFETISRVRFTPIEFL